MNKAIAIGICLVFIGLILIYPSQNYITKPSYFSPPELSILSKFDNETLQSTGRNEYIIELRTPTGIKALEEQNKIVGVLESYGGVVKSRFTVVNAIEAEIDAKNITKIAEVTELNTFIVKNPFRMSIPPPRRNRGQLPVTVLR